MKQDQLQSLRRREYFSGFLMLAVGLGAIFQGRQYKVGTLTEMGPGFFPVALGVLLALIGCAIAVSGGRGRRQVGATQKENTGKAASFEWRGWLCILLSIALFVFAGRFVGLLPAAFLITFVSALGDRTNTWRTALVLSLVMSAVTVVVFWWALGLQFLLFSWPKL